MYPSIPCLLVKISVPSGTFPRRELFAGNFSATRMRAILISTMCNIVPCRWSSPRYGIRPCCLHQARHDACKAPYAWYVVCCAWGAELYLIVGPVHRPSELSPSVEASSRHADNRWCRHSPIHMRCTSFVNAQSPD